MMFGTTDDLVLEVFTQVIEVITVACHTHYQVTVKLWVLLGITQGIGIYHIELYVMAVKAEIAADECSELVIAVFVLKKLRGELLVQEGAACPQVVNFGGRFDYGSRALTVNTLEG